MTLASLLEKWYGYKVVSVELKLFTSVEERGLATMKVVVAGRVDFQRAMGRIGSVSPVSITPVYAGRQYVGEININHEIDYELLHGPETADLLKTLGEWA